MKKIKVMSVIGTRPEGIKMIPLVKALKNDSAFESIFVNTGQHKEQLDQVLELFSVEPDYNLNIMERKPKLEEILAVILVELSKILDKEKPDIVLVHGDTATTLAGAQAAFFRQIPVGHIEAGLRTFDRYSPFPEEMNRQVVGKYTTLHFAATETNKSNLLAELVNEKDIFVVGNTVIDALFDVTSKKLDIPLEIKSIIENPYHTILLTTHRRENLEELNGVYSAVNHLIKEYNDIQFVFPIHKNPAVRKKVYASLSKDPRVHLLEPLDYYVFSQLMNSSYFIITDSGGIQEEAPALKKPVLVARKSTERTEGIEAGTLKLVGTNTETIINESIKLLEQPSYYQSFSRNRNPYGDGKTSEKIVSIIKNYFSS
ncbi:UDP-N-acetylglucosamine 2-epimerase (non-hydrolyzing) [Priestia sp. SB1]|uniref:non-hydrolyzing UDP-N-acetylglucosamine 2-epimerase n=1 Tax=Priestia sp. SB1 TaxID=3132359 RepID=UPI00317D38DC